MYNCVHLSSVEKDQLLVLKFFLVVLQKFIMFTNAKIRLYIKNNQIQIYLNLVSIHPL